MAAPPAPHSCPTCLFRFTRLKGLKQHCCLVKICSSEETANLVVREEGELTRLSKSATMFGSSVQQVFKLCQATKTCMPGLFPLFFCPQGQNSLPILQKIGSVSESYDLLKKAAQEGPVRLPKSLNIKMNGVVLRIDSALLTPKSSQHLRGLKVIENQNYFLVVKEVRRNIYLFIFKSIRSFQWKLGEFTMVAQPIRLILVDWFVFHLIFVLLRSFSIFIFFEVVFHFFLNFF